MSVVAAILASILAGSLVYCVLILLGVRSYLSAATAPRPPASTPISILKPLAGRDLGLEENLRTFFTQDYASWEILFAVRTEDDPAIEVVHKLQAEFPMIPSTLLVTGEPPYANAKVYSLDRMLAQARHDLVVMSDSDIRVAPNFLAGAAAEFTGPNIALATCPYRAIGGPSLWSALEAEGMNTEFIGGFDRLKDYLAEDFMMGKLAAEHGYGVILSANIVEHHIGSEDLRVNFIHRLRWNRSTRRSRPAGYVGQLFTNPLPIALLVFAAQPAWWPVLIPTMVFRGFAAWATSKSILDQKPHWARLLLQDLLSFGFWIAGFFGNTILWRGHRYKLLPDGRFVVAGLKESGR